MLVNLEASSLFNLLGKTALLTGASGYLGRTFARALLMNKARLIALGRSDRFDRQIESWKSDFGSKNVKGYRIDMYDLQALEKLLNEIIVNEPFIDILVNNAHDLGHSTGFNTQSGELEAATFDHWMRNLTGGVYWAALTTQKLGKIMRVNMKGSIINISTMYAIVAPSPSLYENTKFMNPPGYSASKAAMLALTRYTASFWGKYGIRANAIAPGPFSNTQDNADNTVKEGDIFLDRLRARTCLGRIGKPHELVGALLFLASDASSYVTGQTLVIDGGWTII